jgi:predicted nucleic acid-binding protein
MPRVVVDASVAAKWYFVEESSDLAEKLLGEDWEILAPDFIHIEVGAIAWKRVQDGEIDAAIASQILTELFQIPFDRTRATELAPAALALALQTGRTIYDCLYLALAIREGCQLVTADRRFYNSLRDGPFGPHLLWIAQLA